MPKQYNYITKYIKVIVCIIEHSILVASFDYANKAKLYALLAHTNVTAMKQCA